MLVDEATRAPPAELGKMFKFALKADSSFVLIMLD